MKERIGNISAQLYRDPSRLGYTLLLGHYDPVTHQTTILKDYKFETLKLGAMIPSNSSIDIDEGAAIKLMDQLWDAGIRPSKHKEVDGEVEAMRNHIDNLNSALQRDDGILDRMLTIIDLNLRDSVVVESSLRNE